MASRRRAVAWAHRGWLASQGARAGGAVRM
jgi:hypothetical protein